RLGRIDGRLVALPTAEEQEDSDLDLIVASTEHAIVMIEGFGSELPEHEMAEAIMEAHRLNQELIALQKQLLSEAGLPPLEPPIVHDEPLRQTIYERYGDRLRDVKQIVMKAERNSATRTLQEAVVKELVPATGTPAVSHPPSGEHGPESHGDPAPSPVPAA